MASSVTERLNAFPSLESSAKELIPTPREGFLVVFDQPLKPVKLDPPETLADLESDRREPEFGFSLGALYMHVRRLVSVAE